MPRGAAITDLVILARIGDEQEYAAGVSIQPVRSLTDEVAPEALFLTIQPTGKRSGLILVQVVGCSGTATCRCLDEECTAEESALGPDCTCDGEYLFGADLMTAEEARALDIRLQPMRSGCDLDGDLIPDCTANQGDSACCEHVHPVVQTRITDCVDREEEGRAASPFRPREVAATEATSAALIARHRAWCGDGIDNDCRAPADETCGDLDGDGVVAGPDCDDDDPQIGPFAFEVCGNDVDENCDGLLRCDQDGDLSFDDVDCDDLNPDRFPGNAEICGDGVDQNCVPGDEECLDEADIDGDGYVCAVNHRWEVGRCDPSAEDCRLRGVSCTGPGEDCDDSDAGVYPGAPERCGDGIDQDCDGVDLPCDPDDRDRDGVRAANRGGTDCDDTDPTIAPGKPERCGDGVDQDCDGRDLACAPDSDRDQDGWPTPGDCRDGDSSTFPGAPEACNGQDDDCDGRVDEDNPLSTTLGAPAAPKLCGQGCLDGACGCRVGLNICVRRGDVVGVECFGVDPGTRLEICDGVDNDCDGRLDEGLATTCYDGDQAELMAEASACRTGEARCQVEPVREDANCAEDADCASGRCSDGVCGRPAGYAECEAQVLPGVESCSGINEDCDGAVDEAVVRECGTSVGLCQAGSQTCLGAGRWAEECQGEATPMAERCDGRDQDCDGAIDESYRDLGARCTVGTGGCQNEGQRICAPNGEGTVCNVQPGQPTPEVCDGIDNDCDRRTADGSQDQRVGQPCDGDDDDRCEDGVFVCQRGGLVCNDNRRSQVEACDNLDNDCDGQADEDFADLGAACRVGQGVCEREGVFQCAPNRRAVVCSAQPDAREDSRCDGLDNDCDGRVDERYRDLGEPCTVGDGACAAMGAYRCAPDGDGVECSASPVAPSPEVCDGQDNDCNGEVDDGAADGSCDGPLVDRCGGGRCSCGALGEACAEELADACLGGECRCGAGEACVAGQRCVMGECTPP